MIPQERTAAVTSAVRHVFGEAGIEEIHTINKGQSGALVYRIVVRGSRYLLRLITRTSDPTMPQHFTCMNIAAEAGLAPRVLHTSTEDGLSITDFIGTTPLSMREALLRMPAALRTLHDLPAFPSRADHLNTTCTFLLNQNTAAEGFLQRVREANVLPPKQSEEVFARYEQVASAYSTREGDRVSSHNDLFKPDNILFDGSRIWLVDWEAAFLNDRYADLAVVANMLVPSDQDAGAFLENYLGAPATVEQSARFFAVRQIAHLFYALGFLYLGSRGASVDWSEPVPAFEELRQQTWAGERNAGDAPARVVYGRAHLQQFLANAKCPQFTESLRVISQQSQPGRL